MSISRRKFIELAASFGASLTFRSGSAHASFVDLGGHGYSLVRASSDQLEVEFVCIVRPLERSDRADGGPLAYRVTHRVKRWTHEAAPQIERTKVEGTLPVVV